MERIEGGKPMFRMECQCKGGVWKDEVPCGGRFVVTEEDLKVQTLYLMAGDWEKKVIGFECPDCGTFTEIDDKDIPEVIRNRVLAKYHREKPKPAEGILGWLKQMKDQFIK